jgi:hypothetical protein
MFGWLKRVTQPLRAPFPGLDAPILNAYTALAPYPLRRTPRTRVLSALLRQERVTNRKSRRDEVARVLERVAAVEADVGRHARPDPTAAPVVVFNATTSPGDISFTYLAAVLTQWALRLDGQPVVNAVCEAGMIRCPQGTYWYDPAGPPPCGDCVAVRSAIYPAEVRAFFPLAPDLHTKLDADPRAHSLADLQAVTYRDYPLGELCLPSLRHTLRRHNLLDEAGTRAIYADFILSAANVVDSFTALIEAHEPQALVVFNSYTFPEAAARAVALRHGVRAVSYEIGFRPLTAFFSHGRAPDYDLDRESIPDLTPEEDARLDAYLSRRFEGDFTMGGQRFYPEVERIGGELRARIDRHAHLVPVFSNAVYDTSQAAANTTFEDMFDWLDATLALAAEHPDTLFVVRAHPDEFRLSPRRSRETVADWIAASGYLDWDNVMFIPPTEYVSSYDLVRAAKFAVVYNSTINVESILLGVPSISGGRGKFSNDVFAPIYPDRGAYLDQLRSWLDTNRLDLPEGWLAEARRLFYMLFFASSLDLSPYVERPAEGGVTIRPLSAADLDPAHSPETRIIADGIVRGAPFRYER